MQFQSHRDQEVGAGRPVRGVIVAETEHLEWRAGWLRTSTGTIAIGASRIIKSPRYSAYIGRDAPQRVIWYDRTTNLAQFGGRKWQLSPCVASVIFLHISPDGREAVCINDVVKGDALTRPIVFKVEQPASRQELPWKVPPWFGCYRPQANCERAAWLDNKTLAILARDALCHELPAGSGDGRLLVINVRSLRVLRRGPCVSGLVASDGHLALSRYELQQATVGSADAHVLGMYSLDYGKTWSRGNLALIDGGGNPYFWDPVTAGDVTDELRDRNGALVFKYTRRVSWVREMPHF